MTTNRSGAGGRSARWAGGGPGRRLRWAWAFLGLVAVGLSQTGCRSDGCSTCGLGSRLKSNVQALNARIFDHKGGCKTCGALGAESGEIIEPGAPIVSGEVVTPGVITTPGVTVLPPPGTVVPAPGVEVSPELAPIPSPTSGAHAAPISSSRLPAAPAGASAGASRSAYEAVAPRNGNAVAANTKRNGTPSRSGVGSAAADATQRAGFATEEPNLLDQLPPVALPVELTRKANPAEPADPARIPPSDSGPPPTLGGPPTPAAAPTTDANSATPAERSSAGVSAAPAPASAGIVIRATPGIARSSPVTSTVTGGSLPNADGLTWLREKGFKTLVDLRSGGEVDPGFAERVSDVGLVYVALPCALDPIRPDRLARFEDLLSRGDQHPLYFGDTNGRRAGLLWYLHLRSASRKGQATARAQAEEVGFDAALDQARAEEFLKGNFPALASSEPAGEAPESGPTPDGPALALTLGLAPASVSQILDPDPPSLPLNEPDPSVAVVVTPPIPAPAPTPAAPTAIAQVAPSRRASPDRDAEARSPIPFDRSSSWKPMATLVLSGLGVPLAYWSRATLFPRRGPRRASLTAKGPGPRKSLPSSGA